LLLPLAWVEQFIVEHPPKSNQTYIGSAPICWGEGGGNSVDASIDRCLSFYVVDSLVQCLLNPAVFVLNSDPEAAAPPRPAAAAAASTARQARRVLELPEADDAALVGVDPLTNAIIVSNGSLVSLKHASDSFAMSFSDLITTGLFIPMGTVTMIACALLLLVIGTYALRALYRVYQSWLRLSNAPDLDSYQEELKFQRNRTSYYQQQQQQQQRQQQQLQLQQQQHHNSSSSFAGALPSSGSSVDSTSSGNVFVAYEHPAIAHIKPHSSEQIVHLTASTSYHPLKDDDRRPRKIRTSLGQSADLARASSDDETLLDLYDTSGAANDMLLDSHDGQSRSTPQQQQQQQQQPPLSPPSTRRKSELLLEPGEELHTLETLERRLSTHINDSPSRSEYMTEYGDDLADLNDAFQRESQPPVKMRASEVVLWSGTSQPTSITFELSFVIAYIAIVTVPFGLSIGPTLAVATDSTTIVFTLLFAAFAVVLSVLAAIVSRGKKATFMLTNQRWITVTRKYVMRNSSRSSNKHTSCISC
jgi:hypothetical protein